MSSRKVVVMGAGMAGLTAAALLARRGHEVVLIDKEPKAGGYVTGFKRHGFYFDATGAFMAACAPGGEFYAILEELGLADKLILQPIPAIKNIYPDFSLQLDYRHPTAYVKGIMRQFPEQADKLQDYIDLTDKLGRQFLAFEQAPWWKKGLLPLFFPALFRYARYSHGQVLQQMFGKFPQIIQALSALPTTVPPSRLSYLFVAVMWAKVLRQGVFYPLGGMLSITNGFVEAFKKAGGKLVLGKAVREIVVAGSSATGVVLDNGEFVAADRLIGAFNPYQGRKLLSEGGRLFGKIYNLDRFRVSPSALLFYVGLPASALPPDWPYFVSVHTGRDLEQEAQALEDGSLENGLHLVITTPSIIDPSLAPAGHHSLKVLVHAPRADLFAQHYGTATTMEKIRKRVFALVKSSCGIDIERHALFVEQATPMTLARITGNEEGAMYGFDAAIGQVGPQRPPFRTKLDNLLWVGHYTRPAHGIVGSAMSGSFAANIR